MKGTVPDEWLSFYSALHRISKTKLLKSTTACETELEDFNEEDTNESPGKGIAQSSP